MQPPILREVGVDLPIPTRIVVLLDKRRQLRQLFRRKLFHSFLISARLIPEFSAAV